MFSGIVKNLGNIINIEQEGSNFHFTIEAAMAPTLQVDQSIAHNGTCLTVVKIEGNQYVVTAVKETMDKTNLGDLSSGDLVNLEKCIQMQTLLDGHIVQGHVDGVGICTKVESLNGSWYFTIEFPKEYAHLLVDKGSVCINGVSLTVIDPTINTFKVTIIPYTFENTTFKNVKPGSKVNLEFDIVGKYLSRFAEVHNSK